MKYLPICLVLWVFWIGSVTTFLLRVNYFFIIVLYIRKWTTILYFQIWVLIIRLFYKNWYLYCPLSQDGEPAYIYSWKSLPQLQWRNQIDPVKGQSEALPSLRGCCTVRRLWLQLGWFHICYNWLGVCLPMCVCPIETLFLVPCVYLFIYQTPRFSVIFFMK